MTPGAAPGNLIERILGAFVAFALSLVRALIGGFLGAPGKAVEAAVTPVDVRRASADEVVDVRHAVLRVGQPRETAIFDGDDLASTRHWVGERAGMVVAVVTVLARPLPPTDGAPEPPPQWQLRGMAVLPEYRGSGLGGALLQAVHVEVAQPMWCNARERAVPFYRRHGWEPLGGSFDLPPIGPHQRLWWPA